MRSMKIVADSSCDLFGLKHTPFACAPMKVSTAEREFIDTDTLNVGEMVQYLSAYKGRSKSSCPNVADWLEAFGEADDIFCLTITGGLSGSYNSACAAGRLYESEHAGRRVFLLDTRTAGPEITLLVERLEMCIADGMSYDKICENAKNYIQNTGLLFMLKSLKNFANNGRVSPLVAKLVGIAGLCIVGRASDEGTLEPMHKCRGERRSLDTITRELEVQGYRGGRVSIGHCENEAAAVQLRDMIRKVFPVASVDIHALRGLCSFYAERGGVLVGFEKA